MKKFLEIKIAAVLIIALMLSACSTQPQTDGGLQITDGERETLSEQDLTTPPEEGDATLWSRDNEQSTPENSATEGNTPSVQFAPWVPGQSTGIGEVVATINGADVGKYDILYCIPDALWMVQMETMTGGEAPEDIDQAIREEAVRLAAIPVIMRQFAAEHNLMLTDMELYEVSESIADIIDFYGADEFAEILFEDGIQSFDHLEHVMQTFTLVDKVIEYISADEELFVQFEEFLDEMLGAQHILITIEGFGDDEEAEEAAGLFARQIWARAVSGEDFNELMELYSEDPGKEEYPQGYTFVSGVMVPEFEQGTLALEIGEISEPIRAFHGIHIIRRVEPNPEDLMGPSPEQMRGDAIYKGFQAQAENANIVFLPSLSNVDVN